MTRDHLLEGFRVVVVLLGLAAARAHGADAKLLMPNFEALADKANESVIITLDAALLGMAGRFLDDADPEDAAAKEVLKGLTGVYIRSYTFDEDHAYAKGDIDAVRKQLAAPGWNRLVEVRSRKEQADVDIYMSVAGDRANGLAIIASEPRQFTIVNIVGAVDLEKLRRLEGRLGIPEMELEKK